MPSSGFPRGAEPLDLALLLRWTFAAYHAQERVSQTPQASLVTAPRKQHKHTTVRTQVRAVLCYLEGLREASMRDRFETASVGLWFGGYELDEVPHRLRRFKDLQSGRVQQSGQLLHVSR